MKCLITLTILCAAVGLSQQALSREQIEEMAKELISDCAEREGGTQADADHILARKMPAAKIHKCINACVGESVGLLNDRHVDVAAAFELAKTAMGEDDPRLATAKAVAEDCASVTDPDRCEAATKIFMCSIEAGKKRGFDFQML